MTIARLSKVRLAYFAKGPGDLAALLIRCVDSTIRKT